jgi:hypothetical protein
MSKDPSAAVTKQQETEIEYLKQQLAEARG